jgi:hypothetical protein
MSKNDVNHLDKYIIKVDKREPQQMWDNIKMNNISLGLNAKMDWEVLEIADYWFFKDETDILIGERKCIDTDFLNSLFSGLLKDQIKRMLEFAKKMAEKGVQVRIVFMISGNENFLNSQNQKAISTLKANLFNMGMNPFTAPTDFMLSHTFIQTCKGYAGLMPPRFDVLTDPVNKMDTRLVKQLKQFDGLGDKISNTLGAKFKNHLEIVGMSVQEAFRVSTGASITIDEWVKERAMRISDHIREGKEFKKKPTKPLKVIENLVRWEIGLPLLEENENAEDTD